MLSICVPFFEPSERVHGFSKCYDESWVEKLFHGFARNLTKPFKFICFTDKDRSFDSPIEQEALHKRPTGYGSCIEPYRLNTPMILVGLDTVITGNIDHLAEYCMTEKRLALPRDPYHENKVCNGVALVPAGHRDVYDAWDGMNDMEWMRIRSGVALIDDLFPGEVVSYKGSVMKDGLGKAKIVYFHGKPKMAELEGVEWVRENWK